MPGDNNLASTKSTEPVKGSHKWLRSLAVVFIALIVVAGAYIFITSPAASQSSSIVAPATGLQVTDATPDQVLLNWTPSTDAAVTSYVIYSGNTQIASTDALTTSYIVKGLSANSAYTYSVYAQVNGTNSPASNTVSITTPSGLTTISSCGQVISSSGDYVLSANLQGSLSATCIEFENTKNVSLDCQNNTITDAAEGIVLNAVSNFIVDNCNFNAVTPGYDEMPLITENSSDGAMEDNTLGNSQTLANQDYLYAMVMNPTNVDFSYNTVADGYLESQGTDSGCTFNHNNITADAYTPAGIMVQGPNNIVAYNDINGEGGANPGGNDGYNTDDGVVMGDDGITTSNNLVEYNNLENFFDTGVETSGYNVDNTIGYNTITNAAVSGIGGWYWNSMLGNNIVGNSITNSVFMFRFFDVDGIPTGQTVAYFENNTFSGNSYSPGPYYNDYEFYLDPGSGIVDSQVMIANNVFSDNNFSLSTPTFDNFSQGLIIDGGGNVCVSANLVSSAVSCNPTPTPTAPANLTATSTDSSDVFLSWTPAVEAGGSISGYNVFRNGTKINSSPLTNTSYTDTGLSGNSNYTYTVKAVDGSSVSSLASNSAATTTPAALPAAPSKVSAKASSSTSVTVTWSASSDSGGPGLAGYYVLRGGSTIASVAANITSYTDTSVSANTNYSYTIEAYDTASPANVSPPSTAATVTTPATAPTAPTGVSATANSPTSVTISWKASTDSGGPGLAGYYIFRNSTQIAQISGSQTSYSDTTASALSSYSYYLEAYDSANPPNISAASAVATVSTPSAQPTAPTNLSASALSQTSVKLTWSASSDPYGPGLGGYYILRGGVNIGSVNSSTLSYTDNSVIANTAYSYSVEAYDSANPPQVSAASTAALVTTPPSPVKTPPAAPTNLKAALVNSGSGVSLTWTASSDSGGPGVAGYYVLRSTSGGSYTTLTQVTTTSYTDSTVAPSTTYSYEIEAYDNASNVSTASSAVTISTPVSTSPPTAPTNLVATAISSSQINLSWQDSSNNVTNYEVFENSSSKAIATVTTASYGVTNLSANTSYSFHVVAYNGSKASPSSPTISAKTLPKPPTTATVEGTVTASSGGTALSGVEVATNDNYISASTNSAGQYTLTNITPNHSYSYTFSKSGYNSTSLSENYPVGTSTLNLSLSAVIKNATTKH